MTALELADFYELQSWQVANMLRRQHKAIVKLREALQEIADDATDPYTDGWAGAIAKDALKDTEEFK